MKKLIASLAVLSSVAAFGAIDDTMICFSTKGPDKYADGSDVAAGERYALVWAADQFDGFNADGTLVDANDEVLVVVEGKAGRCPLYAYALSATKLMRGGVISLWLLDTRLFGEEETKLAPVESPVKVASVAAAKQAADVTITTSGVPSLAGSATDDADQGVAAALPADAPKPEVRKIEIKNGLVYITVANTAAYLNYDIKSGDTPDTLVSGAAQKPVAGGADEITLVTEQKEGAQFFAVDRK